MRKKTTKRLAVNRESIRDLTELDLVAGGIVTGPASGDVECPTTVGYPGCETGPNGPRCLTHDNQTSCWPDPPAR